MMIARKRIKLPKIEQLKFNEAYLKVLHLFFSYPMKELSLNDLIKLVHISKTTANRVVRLLSEEGFLRVEELGKVWRITCNQKHSYNISRKIPFNLSWIYHLKLVQAIKELIRFPVSISLFGSYRKGDDTEKSDIDIAVEVLDDNDIEIIDFAEIPTLGYRKKVKVNLLKYSRSKIDLNLFSNIANGIVLDGFFRGKTMRQKQPDKKNALSILNAAEQTIKFTLVSK